MASRFRHEDVASVPSGWKVRTVTAGSHRVRVAFPPGRRHKGSGRLVSVLHPLSGSNPCANPCTLRGTNPAELMVMSANNPPRRRHGHNAKMDSFTKQHLKSWLQTSVFSGDRRHVGKIIREYVRRHPEVLTELPSRSWPEVQRMAESSGYNPAEVSVLKQKREARERAAAIRAAAGRNSPRRVFYDTSIQKYTATKYLSKHGNIVASGESKAEAVRNLKAAIARAKGGSHNSGDNAGVSRYAVYKDNVLYQVKRSLADADRLANQLRSEGHSAQVVGPRQFFPQNLGQNPAELLVMAANPRVEVVHGENPPVEDITEEFSGTEVKWIDVYNEPHIPRGRYAYLAKLFRLLIKPAKGGQVQRITFEGDGAPLIVSDASAKQIYFVDGNQDISACLDAFVYPEGQGYDASRPVLLGQAREIHYIGKKHHIGDENTDEWRHTHGEENGVLPTVLFDTRNKRLLYEGGDYRIEGPWIKN